MPGPFRWGKNEREGLDLKKMSNRESFKILVVDDDMVLRRLCIDALNSVGYAVDSARNGLEALDKLNHSAYDLIITDIEMPKLNGIGFYHRAVERYGYLRDRFIFVSGNVSGSARSAVSELNVECFSKPFKLSSLIKRVDALVGVDTVKDDRTPKRCEKRFFWQEDAFVTEDVLNIPIYSQTVDISTHGLKIRYRGRPFNPDSALKVFIRNPGLKIHGTIKWSKSLNETESIAGLRFSRPLPDDSMVIFAEARA